MFSLAYVSDERIAFGPETLSELAERCSARNLERAVTGYLYWRERRFFQFIEGEERAVRALMEEIRADERHALGPLIELGDWESRQFSDWDMCFLDPPDALQTRIRTVVGETMRALVALDGGQASARARVVMLVGRLATLVRENDRAEENGGENGGESTGADTGGER